MKSKTPTIKDVAGEAGCGIATVSRVLNGSGSASHETRDRVLKAAERLGFEFSALGRSLQSSSTKTIGCIVPSLANPVFAEVVQAAQETARKDGYQLLLVCSEYDSDLEHDLVRTLLGKQVDAIILTVSSPFSSPGLELLVQRRLPACLIYNHSVSGIASWSVANFLAAQRVAEAFHEHGHRQTGFLALNFSRSDRSRERYEGFVKACADLQMEEPVLLEIEEQDDRLLEQLEQLLTDQRNLTGIFASNDFLALAAMKAARSLGLKIPEDLSFVGFDGISTGLLVEPNLATIETYPRQMGEGAVRSVLAQLGGSGIPAHPHDHQTFSFRPGGTLGTPAFGRTGNREAATSLLPKT